MTKLPKAKTDSTQTSRDALVKKLDKLLTASNERKKWNEFYSKHPRLCRYIRKG